MKIYTILFVISTCSLLWGMEIDISLRDNEVILESTDLSLIAQRLAKAIRKGSLQKDNSTEETKIIIPNKGNHERERLIITLSGLRILLREDRFKQEISSHERAKLEYFESCKDLPFFETEDEKEYHSELAKTDKGLGEYRSNKRTEEFISTRRLNNLIYLLKKRKENLTHIEDEAHRTGKPVEEVRQSYTLELMLNRGRYINSLYHAVEPIVQTDYWPIHLKELIAAKKLYEEIRSINEPISSINLRAAQVLHFTPFLPTSATTSAAATSGTSPSS